MRSLVFLLCSSTALLAQNSVFTQAPPQVEKALRDRVSGFYQCYVDGKFRQSERYVAEESRDLYYEAEKTAIKSFEVVRVNWEPGYKAATVVTTLERDLHMRGNTFPSKVPVATKWVLADGAWSYTLSRSKERETPFGPMKPGKDALNGKSVEDLLTSGPDLSGLKVDRKELRLKGFEKSSGKIVLSNGLQGSVTVSMELEPMPGLTYTVTPTEVPAGKSSVIEFHLDPQDQSAKPTRLAKLRVDPFGIVVPLRIEFEVQPELQKLLPKQ